MLGLSSSTASHAEPFEPGKGSNVRRREHGRTGAHRSAGYPQKVGTRPSVQPPAGRNEAALIQRLQARGKEKSEDGLIARRFKERDRKSNKVVDGSTVPRATRRQATAPRLSQGL